MDLERYCLVHASTHSQFETAAALRRELFQERRQLGFDEALEAARDRAGHVFLLLERGCAVAVGRVSPYPSPLSSVDLSRYARELHADSEIGRVASVASSETPLCALLLFTLGSCWLLRHTRLRRYVGHCQPKLVRLYQKVGASAGEELWISGRSEPQRVIGGQYRAAAELGCKRLGISAARARALTDAEPPTPTALDSHGLCRRSA